MSSEKVGRLLQPTFFLLISFPFFILEKKRKWTCIIGGYFSGLKKTQKNKMPFLFTTDRFEVFARPPVSSVCVSVKTFVAHHSRLLFFCQFFFQMSDVCIHHPSNNGNRKTLKTPARIYAFLTIASKGTRTNDDDVAESQTNLFLFLFFFLIHSTFAK